MDARLDNFLAKILFLFLFYFCCSKRCRVGDEDDLVFDVLPNHCKGMTPDLDRFEGVREGNPAAMVEDGQDGYRRRQVERSWRLSATLRTRVESVRRSLHA